MTLSTPQGQIYEDLEDGSGRIIVTGPKLTVSATVKGVSGDVKPLSIDLGPEQGGTVVIDVAGGQIVDIRTGSEQVSGEDLKHFSAVGDVFVTISDDPDGLNFIGAPDPAPESPPETPPGEFDEYVPPESIVFEGEEEVITSNETIAQTITPTEPSTGEHSRNRPRTQTAAAQPPPPPQNSGERPVSDGDPVNLVTGEFYTEERPDIVLRSRGGLVLSVQRRYRSQAIYNGPFGYGWTWNHSETILPEPREQGPDDLVYYDAHRTPYLMTNNNDGTYAAPPGILLKLKAEANTYRVVDARGNVREFSRPDGVLLRKEDKDGNGITFGYGVKGRLKRMRDDLGQSLRFSYNADGKVERVTDSTGRSVSYVYDGNDLIEYWDAEQTKAKQQSEQKAEQESKPEDGQEEAEQNSQPPTLVRTQYAYYKQQTNPLNNHNMKRYTLPSGDSLEIHYYHNDRVSHHISKSSDNTPHKRFDFQYSPLNQTAWTTNEKSQKRVVSRNDNLDVTKIVELDGSVEHRRYDKEHNLIQLKDRAGRCTQFDYDRNHKNPLNRRNLIEVRRYLDDCPKVQQTDEQESDNEADGDNKECGKEDADSVEDDDRAMYEKTRYCYYPDDYQSGAARFTDEGAARLHRVIDDAGYETTFVYDPKDNRLTRQIQQLSFAAVQPVEFYRLDANGHPIKHISPPPEDHRRHEVVFGYDGWGNVTSVAETGSVGALRKVTFRYDLFGLLLLNSTDANEKTIHYTYDSLHRLTGVTDPLGHTALRAYDATGRLLQAIDVAGETTEYQYNENGQLTKHIAPDQEEWTFEYGTARDVVTGRPLVARVNPLGHRESYEYDRVGNVTTIIAPNGHEDDGTVTGEHQTQIDYDPARRPIQITDASGEITRVQYNGVGQISRRTLANGGDETYRYDGLGRLVESTDVLGRKTQIHYGHDADNPARRYYEVTGDGGAVADKLRVVRIADPDGLTTRQEYNVRGQLIRQLQYASSQADPVVSDSWTGVLNLSGVRETRFDYDELGRLVRTTDGKGRRIYRTYDGNNNLILQVVTVPGTDPKSGDSPPVEDSDEDTEVTTGETETIKTYTVYQYDDRNQLIRQIDALGNETEYDYDRRGQLVSVTDALGFATQIKRNSLGQAVQVTTADLAVTKYVYDSSGRITSIIDPLGEERSVVYDKNGNPIEQIDLLGERTRYDFDARNRLIAVANAKAEVTSLTYDALSNVTKVVDALGHHHKTTFDIAGRITSSTDPLGRVTQIDYDDRADANDLRSVTVRDPMAFVTTRRYNPFGDLETATDPVNTERSYDYNDVGELTQETWTPPSQPKIVEADYTPGLFGLTESDRGGTKLVRNYDALGRLVKVTQDDQVVQDFDYDALSRLTYAASYEDGEKVHEVILEYDEVGRVVAEVQDGMRVETRYDDAGNMTDIIYPPESSGGSGLVVKRQIGPGHLVDAISDQENTVLVDYDHDKLGRVKRETLQTKTSIATTIDYDAVGRQTDRDFAYHQGHGMFSPLGHVHLDYDKAGNVTSKSTSHPWNIGVTDTYRYDANDRLESVTRTPKQGSKQEEPSTFEWQLDELGNWLAATGPRFHLELDFDYQNRITNEPYDYDARGNLKTDGINTYEYDALDQLVTVSNDAIVIRYIYDAVGRRVTETRSIQGQGGVQEMNIRYIYHGLSVIEERISQDGEATLRSYVYGQSMDDRVMMQIDDDRYFYVKDHQQSPAVLVSASGNPIEAYEYAPYGQMTVQSGPTDTPTETIESTIGNPYGYTGRRWDAATGLYYYRNRDYHPGLGRFLQNDPAGYIDGWNRYAYVANNPASFVDPLGLTKQHNDEEHSSVFFGSTDHSTDIVLNVVGPDIAQGAIVPTVGASRSSGFFDDAQMRKMVLNYEGTRLERQLSSIRAWQENRDLRRRAREIWQAVQTDEGGRRLSGAGFDALPGVGDTKGLIEVVTGTDIYTGEELGNWRWAGLIFLGELRHLRKKKASREAKTPLLLGPVAVSRRTAMTVTFNHVNRRTGGANPFDGPPIPNKATFIADVDGTLVPNTNPLGLDNICGHCVIRGIRGDRRPVHTRRKPAYFENFAKAGKTTLEEVEGEAAARAILEVGGPGTQILVRGTRTGVGHYFRGVNDPRVGVKFWDDLLNTTANFGDGYGKPYTHFFVGVVDRLAD